MAYVWGMLLFGEPPSLLSSLGTVLVISGLVTVTLNKAPMKVRFGARAALRGGSTLLG